MTDAEPDTKIAINIRPSVGGGWMARSPTKPKMEEWDTTPEDALIAFVRALQDQIETGAKIRSEITGVSAVVGIYTPENHALAEFGIGGEEIPAPEERSIPDDGVTVQTNGTTRITIGPGLMQAMHDAASEIREELEPAEELHTCSTCGNWIPPAEGEIKGECDDYGCGASGDSKACMDYIPREEQETDEEGETTPTKEPETTIDNLWCVSCKYRNIKEGRASGYCGHPNETGEHIVYGFTPACRWHESGMMESLNVAFGLSLGRYEIGHIISGAQTHIILPPTSKIRTGDRIIAYEKGEMKGRKAYVGEFVAGEIIGIERSAALEPEWNKKLHMDEGQISAAFGTSFSRFALEITNYREYADSIQVPDGLKAPRGVNWIPPMHIKMLFPEAKE